MLMITPEIESEIAAAIAKARANVIPWKKVSPLAAAHDAFLVELADRKPGTELRPPSVGLTFPGGVTAAISFEEQPAGILRHVSFATGYPGKKRLLNPVMLAELCKLFGVREFPPTQGRVWVEEFQPGYYAINVIELEVERPAHTVVQ